MAVWLAVLVFLPLLALFVTAILGRSRRSKNTVGFFHPYCNDGGGGERVLWETVMTLHEMHPSKNLYVFHGGKESGDEILTNAQRVFGLAKFDFPITFLQLRSRVLVEAWLWPVFTMLGQSLGSIVLGLEALLTFVPEVYIDTMGYAFTMPLFRIWGGSQTVSYVHYPTISKDMLSAVFTKSPAFNHHRLIASSSVLTWLKLQYYKWFAYSYGCAGACSQITMVNSSWTQGHITEIWGKPVTLVYPPCDVEIYLKLPLSPRKPLIISVAQFRPEKNHTLQVMAFAHLLTERPQYKTQGVRLILMGGCRHAQDAARVQALQSLIDRLGLSHFVSIRTNVGFQEKLTYFSEACAGLHTMANEHFGIGVVEFMAAGVIPIAHHSGGPLQDIVTPSIGVIGAAAAAAAAAAANVKEDISRGGVGCLAQTKEEYASAMHLILTELTESQRGVIQANARVACQRFSCGQFRSRVATALRVVGN